MKKLSALLLTAALVLCLTACGKTENVSASPAPALSVPSGTVVEEVTELPVFDTEPAAAGKVLYMNPDPAADSVWQSLAAAYSASTGIPVTVNSVGENYNAALESALSSADAPTLFALDRDSGESLIARAADLRDTAVYGELTAVDTALRDSTGRIAAVPYALEHYGVLVNTDLIASSGNDMAYIDSFSHLRIVANDLHARRAELGFDGFVSSCFTDGEEYRYTELLSGVFLWMDYRDQLREAKAPAVTGAYLEDFHDFMDLLSTTAPVGYDQFLRVTAGQSLTEFAEGKAAFMIGGTADLDELLSRGMTEEQLTLLPLYCSLHLDKNPAVSRRGCRFWSVNAEANEDDLLATLDFLSWVVTSPEALTVLHGVYDVIPFRSAPAAQGPFARQAAEREATGAVTIPEVYNIIPAAGTSHTKTAADLRRYIADTSYWNWYGIAKDTITADWGSYVPAQ